MQLFKIAVSRQQSVVRGRCISYLVFRILHLVSRISFLLRITLHGRRITFVILLFLIPNIVYAVPVDKTTAEKLAKSYIEIKYIQYNSDTFQPVVSTVFEFLTVGSDTLAYMVDLNPTGFILISGDTEMKAVVSYSWNGSVSSDPIFQSILKMDIQNRWKYRQEQSSDITDENKSEWDFYLNFDGVSSSGHRVQSQSQWPAVNDSGWLDTEWHQSSPYNDLCPIDPSTTTRSVVGCVATAYAQIINYHKYPTTIVLETEDRYISASRGIAIDTGSVTSNFPAFSQLNTLLSNIDYSDPAEAYAPALNFACGIFVEMDYTSSSSGATTENSITPFTEKLAYREARYMEGSDYRFYDNLKEDMKSGLPSFLLILSTLSSTGHAIVADGYRTTGEYHLNFGWGTGSPAAITDAWYILPEGMPANYSIVYGGLLNITPPAEDSNAYGHVISYPNPFYPETTRRLRISLQNDNDSRIEKLKIFDLAGNFVVQLTGGKYAVWDGKNSDGYDCASGLYFYSIRTEDEKTYRGKISLIR